MRLVRRASEVRKRDDEAEFWTTTVFLRSQKTRRQEFAAYDSLVMAEAAQIDSLVCDREAWLAATSGILDSCL